MGSSGGKDIEGAGIPGEKGERGEDGNSVHSGSGIPSSELGVNGDYYVNNATHTIYGPKTGGTWGSATSLVGERGETGLTGAEGPKGSTGATGTAGAEGPGATLGEWKALSLETGITNLGAPYANAQCSKDSLGLIYLRGVVKSSGLLSKEAVIVTLPEGYRPTKQQLINANFGGTLGFLYILANGKIQISLGVSLETNFSFDGIFFPLV